MSEPKLPRQTCPAIDDIIKCSENVISMAENIVSDIERLRDANSALREYGEYWKEQYDDLMSDYEKLEREAVA